MATDLSIDYLADDPDYQEELHHMEQLILEQKRATASYLNTLAADETNYEGEQE